MQNVRYKSGIHFLADIQFQRFAAQFFTGHNFLSQRIRISYDTQSLLPFLQTAQYFRTKNLIRRVFLAILDGTSEGRGKEKHCLRTQYLCQVVIEISGLFKIT